MKIAQVACITFTIRDFIKTPEDFRTSMKKLADIGYQAVQISGMAPDVMPAEEIVAVCAENGLTICATHEPSQTVLDEPEEVVERLKNLGTKYTAYPYPRDVDMRNPEDVATLIKKLDNAGKVLREAGQVLTYHNHALEFVKLDGRPVLQHIYDRTDPINLQAEIDTYWVQLGGGDPVEWCKMMNNRLPLLHLKDVGLGTDNSTTMVEIGNGNLNFKAIVAAAEASGCEWFIVEQDRCPGNPFDSLKQSFDYIKANLCES
jgi:sugar phosphate isomerase/epimerase